MLMLLLYSPRYFWCNILSLEPIFERPAFKHSRLLFDQHTLPNMSSISAIVARSSALLHTRNETQMSSTMIDLLIALMILVFVALCLIGTLYAVRKIRTSRAIARQQLPMHNESSSRPMSNHRRLTITAAPYGRNSSIYVCDEKSPMMKNPLSPPHSPDNVPEIHITFPDEHDESGRRKSGRVVVVRVGETSVGLEPLNEEQLPAYEKETGGLGGRFHSIDMDRIGGLKEKNEYC